MIQTRGVAKTYRVGGGKQSKEWVRVDHFVLIQQGQFTLEFENTLNDKHYVWSARVILVEYQGHRVLQRPGQNALAELSNLLTVLQHNGIFADQIDTADVAV